VFEVQVFSNVTSYETKNQSHTLSSIQGSASNNKVISDHEPTRKYLIADVEAATVSPTRKLPTRGEIITDNANATTPLKCIPNTCPNNMCPGDGMPLIPDVRIDDQGRTMNKQFTKVSENWGNVLSPYWAARSIAELGGYQYKGSKFGQGSWMEFLPTYAPARVSNKELFQQVCGRCTNYKFFNKGECSEGWSHIAPAIMNETQCAIKEHAKRAPKEENDKIFDFFHPNDWLVYNRCCVFKHGEIAPGVLKTFDAIPTKGSFTVHIMMGRDEDPYRLCKTIVHESIDYMKQRNPAINVTILDRASLYVDYSRMVFAPNVLVAGMGSSWALWSAVLSNSNNVVAHTQRWVNVSMLPNNVKFLLDVPTLLNPAHHFADIAPSAYGIKLVGGKFSNSTEDREKVLNYFRGVTETKVLHYLENLTAIDK
jgi:hypothetical protein